VTGLDGFDERRGGLVRVARLGAALRRVRLRRRPAGSA
jgi:hypothetical protein